MHADERLHKKLSELWGPEDQWPVAWEDVAPSVDLWMREKMSSAIDGRTEDEALLGSVDEMVEYVEECVQMLRKEGLL